MRESERKRR
jgi:hypothetical protein